MNSLLSKLTSVKVALDGKSTMDSGNKQELPAPASIDTSAAPLADKSIKLLSVLKKSTPPTESTSAPSINTNLPLVPKADSGSPTSTASTANASPPLAPTNGESNAINGNSSPTATTTDKVVATAGVSSAVKSQKLLSILKSDTKVTTASSTSTSVNSSESAATPQQVKIEPTASKVTKKDQLLSMLSGGGNQSASSVPISNSATTNTQASTDLLTDADIAKSLNKAKQIVNPPIATTNPSTASADIGAVVKVKPPLPVSVNNTTDVVIAKVPASNTVAQPSVASNKFKIGSPVLAPMNSPGSTTSGIASYSSPGLLAPKLPITSSAKKPAVTLISPSDLENM
jgi:hypothetical protein